MSRGKKKYSAEDDRVYWAFVRMLARSVLAGIEAEAAARKPVRKRRRRTK